MFQIYQKYAGAKFNYIIQMQITCKQLIKRGSKIAESDKKNSETKRKSYDLKKSPVFLSDVTEELFIIRMVTIKIKTVIKNYN